MFSIGTTVKVVQTQDEAIKPIVGRYGVVVGDPTIVTPKTWEVSVPGSGLYLLYEQEFQQVDALPVVLEYQKDGHICVYDAQNPQHVIGYYTNIFALLYVLQGYRVTAITYEPLTAENPVVK